ncbi:hypothetical protein I6F33_30755 [Bradyrhizobium sp. BRP20]|uniref:hypothetical protein n=1 Tax=unclassified Bradyrhizobium TaxID=2631580 RepID=UPI001CD206D0|nr:MULTISPECIES: hypothetical protein [unclassified Bradyrhizobium]MCA1437313.1 hypothetical protein [Bradyrhizobium sp. BRP20]MCA1551404.1 hypothetical protein [Bradyrhizobium sp. BRP19]
MAVDHHSLLSRPCRLSASLPRWPAARRRTTPAYTRAFALRDKAAANLSHPVLRYGLPRFGFCFVPPAVVDRHEGGHGAAEKARELIHGKRQGRSLDDLLWSTVNLFDRAVDRVERELAINEQALQRGQREQNGCEMRSVESERLTAEVLALH